MEQGEWVVARYQVVDAAANLARRAEEIAVGLTVGSWTDLKVSEQAELRPFRGAALSVEVIGERQDGRVTALLRIGYPVANLTATFAALLTTVFGKLSMDGEIRLVGLDVPDALLRAFPGPAFGVDGVRAAVRVFDRPLLMSIFKSCVGQSLSDLALHFREQAQGGADIVKDDEIFFRETEASPEDRCEAFAAVADGVAAQTGKRTLYAVNLTGAPSELRRRAQRLADAGAGMLLFNVYAYGLDLLAELAADSSVALPILAHPAFAGALYAAPAHGVAPELVLGQWVRMAGADVAIYPSPYGSVTLPAQDGAATLTALRRPGPHKAVLPAPSAGIHPGLVPRLMRDYGVDVIVNAGGGVHGHPDGPAAGGQAFLAAIAAGRAGVSLEEASRTSEPLARALAKFGGSGA